MRSRIVSSLLGMVLVACALTACSLSETRACPTGQEWRGQYEYFYGYDYAKGKYRYHFGNHYKCRDIND